MQAIARIINDKTIHVYDLTQFNIDAIVHSGQVFRYFPAGKGYRLVVGGDYAHIYNSADIAVISCSDAHRFWNYFDLNTDYNDIKSKLQKYKSLLPAIEAGGGIRILRSEFNETVISFIISAFNNIKRFTKTLNALAEKYGKPLPDGLFSFPTLPDLSVATEDDFRALGCGYRAPYLVRAIDQLKKIDISVLSKLTSVQIDKHLRSIAGVGAKVSACCRLFTDQIHDLSVCPMDTWLKKAVELLPQNDKDALQNDAYAGVAQQYVFYWMQYLHKAV